MTDHDTFDTDDRLVDIDALLREIDETDFESTTPPDDLWAGIESALDGAPIADVDAQAQVVTLASRRRTRAALSAAAAVAVLAVGAVAVMSFGDGDDTVLASTELEYTPDLFDELGADASATVQLVERAGSFELRLDDASLPDDLGEPAELELWLIELDDDGEVVDIASIAQVDDADSYTVPSSIDVTTHRIVDISVEPLDGDDTHSGRSILRGDLDA